MNTLLSYRLVFAVWCGVLLNTLCAQSPSYYRYTTADGLPTNYVYGVVEDEEGYIWAYTENGLAKFDGYTFKHFTTENGLPGNDIPWALQAPDGKIWLYTYQNRPAYLLNDSIYVVYDAPARLLYLLPDGCPLYTSRSDRYTYDHEWKSLNILHISPQEFAWLGQNWQVIQSYPNTPAYQQTLERQVYKNFYTETADSIITWNVNSYSSTISQLSQSSLFYAHNDSLHWQVDQKWLKIPFNGSFHNQWYLGAEKWVFHLNELPGQYLLLNTNNAEVQYFSTADYRLAPKYHSHISTQDSTFWLESDVGSVQLDTAGQLQQKIVWTKKEQAWRPLRTYTDREGNIWQGTRNGGLLMIPFTYQGIRKRKLPPSGNQYIERLLNTPDGKSIGITENGQVYDIGPDTIRSLYKMENGKYFRAAEWLDDQLFLSLSTEALLLSLDADTTKAQSFPANYNCTWFDQVQGNFTSVTYSPLFQQLFFTLSSNSIYRWDLAPINEEQCQANLLADMAHLLYIHPNTSTIYGGGIDGLTIMENERLLPFFKEEGELKNISALLGTPNKLWIGTESNGLFCYHFDTQKLEKVVEAKYIRTIRPDGDRGILVATNEGVFVIPANEPGDFRQYTPLDGLPTFEIKDVLALGDSVLLVASSDGLHELQRNFHGIPPQRHNTLQLKAIYANEQAIQAEALEELPYTTKQLDFVFQLRSYASRGNIQYQTRLEPLESNWQQSPEQFRRYTGLRPGNYQFQIASIDIYGWRTTLPKINIYIRPALWQRLWFQVSLLISLFGLTLGWGLRRLKQAKKQLAAEQALNRRLAVMELEALKAQMNPHFIFNALGSIQYFIQTQEVELADDYLTRFASLMRQYLDSSRETLLPLEQEIALLTNYTKLEQMRFEELFQVEITVADGLLNNGYDTPTMIIQPFVENAINHGLSERRDGLGKLSIGFSQIASDTLCCTVNDNGVGRKRAAQRARAGHKSRGMLIVQEKIDTLLAADLVKVSYTIADAHPADEDFPGTVVTIYFKSLDDANH